MDKNYIVKKSNYFIMNCSYDLSLEEQKLILTLASMVQPSDEDFKPYKFRINDFMKLLGVDTKTKYTEIPKITKDLMKKVFEIEEDDVVIQTAWLSSATYKKGTGVVELEFSPRLKPYMLKLNTMFTQYKLANILSMKSKYSPRIYEILKCNEFKKQGYIEIEVEELRKLLKADNIYPLYADFKRKVIIQTQKELKKISDISFEFEEIKTGRKVTALRFFIHSNTDQLTNKANVIDEVVVDREGSLNKDKINNTMEVLDNKVNDNEALCIYNSAAGDIELITKAYEYVKTKNVDNFVGYMIKVIEKMKSNEFNEPQKFSSAKGFNNFEPRQYDYEDLEKKLLGWTED